MQLSSSKFNLTDNNADCLIVFVNKDSKLISSKASAQNELSSIVALTDSSGALSEKPNSHILVPTNQLGDIKTVLIYRLSEQPLNAEGCRETASKIASRLLNLDRPKIAVDLGDIKTEGTSLAKELSLAIVQASYKFEDCKSTKSPARKIQNILLMSEDDITNAVIEGTRLAEGINLARDLGNMPGNVCTPVYLSKRAEQFVDELGIQTEVLGEAEMQELGMGSLLSVSVGSDEPAQLIVMKYFGAESKDEKPYALVGKGITFDTGGISLKPGAAMDEMKFDMCGAASVFGAVHAVAKLKLPINLVAVVAAAENMPSGRATKPGDVVTSMSGQTIEVLNTDAEGRLVLCDALSYVARFEPQTTIDIATLTGACIIALGSHASGLYANDDQLGADILESAERTGDKAWRMPLWPEYDKQLKSNFADIANIGGREAGSVTAACFLARFTKDQRWAHLDIAGTAWKSGGSKGATGRPVRLLVDYLMSRTTNQPNQA